MIHDYFFKRFFVQPGKSQQQGKVVLSGGNNIRNLRVSPDTKAAELMSRFCSSQSAVVCCSIIPRREGGFQVLVGFEACAKQFNTVN